MNSERSISVDQTHSNEACRKIADLSEGGGHAHLLATVTNDLLTLSLRARCCRTRESSATSSHVKSGRQIHIPSKERCACIQQPGRGSRLTRCSAFTPWSFSSFFAETTIQGTVEDLDDATLRTARLEPSQVLLVPGQTDASRWSDSRLLR